MNTYVYIAAMALATYLVRMLPLTVFRKPIKSRFVRSFLHYVPYACLAAMTFPAILQDTASVFSGAAALVVAVGCTGGHHRSVAIAHALAAYIRGRGYPVTESHRDLGRT